MIQAKVWRDSEGKNWCQLPGEPPERLLTPKEIAALQDGRGPET